LARKGKNGGGRKGERRKEKKRKKWKVFSLPRPLFVGEDFSC